MLRLLHIKTSPFPHLSSTTATFIDHLHLTTLTPTSPTSNSTSTSSSSLTLYFLKNSCGLPHEIALTASKKINITTTTKPNSVLTLFKSYNFTQPHITKIVTGFPKLLNADPNKTLKPKLNFFQSIGFVGPDLISLVTSDPSLFHQSLQKKLVHNYNLLKSFLHTDANVVNAIKHYTSFLRFDLDKLLLPSIKTLVDYGVPVNVLTKLLTRYAKSLVAQPNNRLQEILDLFKKIGINPRSLIFAHAFGVLGRMRQLKWDKSMKNFKMLGWSEAQVLNAFARHPSCMTVSTHKIAKNMQLFKERFNWDPTCISVNPVLLSLSFDKRIVPRCRVLDILKSKGLMNGEVKSWHLLIGERVFLKAFVMKYYKQVPELVDDALKRKMEDLGLLMGGHINEVK